MSHFDVHPAYFYAKTIRDIYAQVLEEDSEPGPEGERMRGRPKRATYGTRDTAKAWGC